MNDRARLNIPAIQLTRALVRGGLARFAAARLNPLDPLFVDLGKENDLSELLGLPPDDDADADAWRAACKILAELAPQLPGPLGRLLQDFRLQLPAWFLLGLAGEVDGRHRAAQLRQPVEELLVLDVRLG